ncbi:MAG: glucokinase [Beijerinckiaceae bacterium]|nr:glucokinase [Beijerinckiaceae bacterium]
MSAAVTAGSIGARPWRRAVGWLLLPGANDGRVSVERILSGPGLFSLYGALARISDETPAFADERSLWTAAIAGSDPLARQALDRFCSILGSVCGDIVLVQGASALVLAGGIVPRLGDILAGSHFVARFRQKGRFTERMAGIPIFRILHPQPGLLGAAAAFAERQATGVGSM